MNRRALLILMVSALCAPPVWTAESDAALIDKLRQGGYVIYIRHTATDMAQQDTTNDYDDCAKQRNLTDQGREQARALGTAFKALKIAVGRVIASPFCRTRETAQLAFGEFERVPSYAETKQRAQEILSTPPAPGPNTVIVAHGFILRDLAHIQINEGEAAIFQPRGANDFNLVARVTSEQWTEWANDAK
ncbi:MAG: histidine phosphatase family protein [Gammaproteobacteria bacterium]